MRKGQITIFFVIGLVLVIIVGILFYIRSQIQVDNDLINQQYVASNINTYVESCLNEISSNALELLGAQGGMLYEEQQGPIGENSYHNIIRHAKIVKDDSIIKIGFGLVEDNLFDFKPSEDKKKQLEFNDNSHYGYDYGDSGALAEDFSSPFVDGPFGQFALPRACDPNGANAKKNDNLNIHCLNYAYRMPFDNSESIQEEIATYIDNHMENCVKEQAGEILGSELKFSDSTTEIIFSEDGLLINYDLPIKIEGDFSTKIEHFDYEAEIRIVKIFEFVHELLMQESKNLSFDLSKKQDYESLETYDGFVVKKGKVDVFSRDVNFANSYSQLYIVEVHDTKSFFKGANYVFQFLIENRDPLISYGDISGEVIPQKVCSLIKDPDDEDVQKIELINADQEVLETIIDCSSTNPISLTEDAYLRVNDSMGSTITRIKPVYKQSS